MTLKKNGCILAVKIGVVGLWHLGCVITASWLKLGNKVVGVDFDADAIRSLSKANPPIFEPQLQELFKSGLEKAALQFTTDPSFLKDCDYVFIAYDTPVDNSDCYDLSPIEQALEKIAPHLSSRATLIISSQVPVGTTRRIRKKWPIAVIYSPENLRLGEAVDNYLNPGHIVIGSDSEQDREKGKALFSSIPATYCFMDLSSAEMTKHAINSFLATSITFANQLSDACSAAGADFNQVAQAMRIDPRIGQKAYLKAGIGFSGGTLGRDLQILESINRGTGNVTFPLFGKVWEYNRLRPSLIVKKIESHFGKPARQTISLLGLTYKPGTSTLRRSVPLEIAHELARKGYRIRVYDPKANWKEANLEGIEIFPNPDSIARDSDLIVLLTEWPEFKDYDYALLAQQMKIRSLYDPHSFLKSRYPDLKAQGFQLIDRGL